jgi:hypothetical protein
MLRRLIVALRPALGLASLLMGRFNRGLARGRGGVAYETCTHGRNIRQRSRMQSDQIDLTESTTRMVIRVVLGAESLLVKNNGV